MTSPVGAGTPTMSADGGRTAASSGKRSAAPSSSYRADVQGLRVVASLLVAVYHTWYGTVSGGVDVFFVLTGMLMTGTLLGNVRRTGGIDLRNYLARLGERLFPLAGLVLLVVAIVTVIAVPAFQQGQAWRDIYASATYWQNWNLAQQSTDYLALGTEKSPVQHYWAMSVQGQFYLIWAAVVGAAVLLAKVVRRWSLERWVVTLVIGVSAASGAWALYATTVNPVFTYYDTWARLWEFGVGALVYVFMRKRRLSFRMRTVFGLVGLALLLTAGLAPSEWHYPGLVALWPVAGAVALLLSHQPGVDRPGIVTRLLGSKPLEKLGGYSYGIYLWSWPVLVGYWAMLPEGEGVSLLGGLACIAIAIVLAWASIEGIKVIQAWWRGDARRQLRRARVPVTAALVPAIAVVALVVPVAQQLEHGGGAGLYADTQEPVTEFTSFASLRNEVSASLELTELPELHPGFGQDGRPREWVEQGCATVTPENIDDCRFVDGPEISSEVIVIGDSQAITWVPGLRAATGSHVAIQNLGREMCPWSTTNVSNEWQGIDAHAACNAHNEWTIEVIEERQPDLVVLSFGVWHGERVIDAADAYEGMQLLAQGVRPLVDRLLATGVPVVWLDSPPSGLNIHSCAAASTPDEFQASCTVPVLYEQLVRISLFTDLAREAGIRYVSTLAWFCDESTLMCPGVMRGMAVQADGSHLTWGMSRALAPILATSLRLDELRPGPQE